MEPKLPSEKFTASVGILQDFLLTASEKDLPQLWHQLPNCNKQKEFSVLLEQQQAYSCSPGAFLSCTPGASAKLVQDLVTLTFVGENADNMKLGIQSYIAVYGTTEHRQANLEIEQTYGMLNAGNNALS